MWLLNSNIPNRSEKTFDPIRRRECDGGTEGRRDGRTHKRSIIQKINQQRSGSKKFIHKSKNFVKSVKVFKERFFHKFVCSMSLQLH